MRLVQNQYIRITTFIYEEAVHKLVVCTYMSIHSGNDIIMPCCTIIIHYFWGCGLNK